MGYYSSLNYELEKPVLKRGGKKFIELLFSGYRKEDFEGEAAEDYEFDVLKVYNKINAELVNEFEDETIENMNINGFDEVELIVNSSNELEEIDLNDYYAKFYDDLLFAIALSKVLESGKVIMTFTGEDGEKWQIIVEPDRVESYNLEDISAEDLLLFKRWKEYIKILEKIKSLKENDPININAGPHFCKLETKSVEEIKASLYYLFHDLAIDLKIADFEKEKLSEIW